MANRFVLNEIVNNGGLSLWKRLFFLAVQQSAQDLQ